MKRASFGLALCLILSACGGGASVSCTREYQGDQVTLCLPGGWSVLDGETLRERGVPEDTIAALQTDEPVSGQFPTVTVTFEPLTVAVTPEEYSEASVRAVAVLPGYEQVDSVVTTIDGYDVALHIFDAQPIADEPKRRFYQVSTVSGGDGYSVTGSAPVAIDDDVEGQILTILQSATFAIVEEEGEE